MKKYIPGAILVALILVGIGFIASSNPDRLGAQVLSPIVINPIIAPVKIPTRCDPAKPITVTVDSSSPAGGTYTAGTTGNDFGHFKITANCNVTIGWLALQINPSNGFAPNILGTKFYWYDGPNLIGSNSDPFITNSNGFFSLTAGQSKIITVKIDLASQTVAGAARIILDAHAIPSSGTVPVSSSPYAAWFKIVPGGCNPLESMIVNDLDLVRNYTSFWCSSDGISWTRIGIDPQNGATDQAGIFFNNKFWVMGGWGWPTPSSSIWLSPNGINWTQVTTSAPWGPRHSFALIVYAGKMWLMGGSSDQGNTLLNDVWSSSDGVNWTQVTAHAGWSPRRWLSATVFNGKMWIMNGDDGVGSRDAWSSTDGVNWIRETINTTPPSNGSRTEPLLVLNNKLWLILDTGMVGQVVNTVWSSSDGKIWSQVTPNVPWSGRFHHTAYVYNGKIYVVGGFDWNGNGLRDVWSSSDGANWVRVTSVLPFVTDREMSLVR